MVVSLPITIVVQIIMSVSPGNAPMSFTLSFVNGKTTPTYRNYQALLAGFKLPF